MVGLDGSFQKKYESITKENLKIQIKARPEIESFATSRCHQEELIYRQNWLWEVLKAVVNDLLGVWLTTTICSIPRKRSPSPSPSSTRATTWSMARRIWRNMGSCEAWPHRSPSWPWRPIGAANARQVSALRAFCTRLRDAFPDYRNTTVNIDVLLTWATTRFSGVRVRHEARKFGQSGYTPRKLVHHALNMTTGFSIRPLQIASLMGFAFSFSGLVILAYALIRWLMQGSAVPGFAFLAFIIAVLSGAQLMALGIIEEYMARMHFRTMEWPPYVVRQETTDQSV